MRDYGPLLAHIAELTAQASPGPWYMEADHIRDYTGEEIFENTCNNEDREANAKLAAPAHEMAACVVALAKICKETGEDFGPCEDSWKEGLAALAELAAAWDVEP